MTAQTQTLELPTELYETLVRAAQDNGTTPTEWIAARLPHAAHGNGNPETSEDALAEANARLFSFSGIAKSGNPRSADNEQIDADLYK
jgi:hypothetical protein